MEKEETFNGAVKGAMDADIGDLHKFQSAAVMILTECTSKRLDIRCPCTDSAADSVPGLEECGRRVGGDVAVDSRDEYKPETLTCHFCCLIKTLDSKQNS